MNQKPMNDIRPLMSGGEWSKAFVLLNTHSPERISQLRRGLRIFSKFLPKAWLRKYLLS